MDRSFHAALSERHYVMIERDGRYYQRRYQVSPGNSGTNLIEKEIRYVLGSGNHSRAYLHLAPAGQLVQLPLGWYSEDGGKWAMSPGYDRPDHMDFRRKIGKECFFCHNAYPAPGAATKPPKKPFAVSPSSPPELTQGSQRAAKKSAQTRRRKPASRGEKWRWRVTGQAPVKPRESMAAWTRSARSQLRRMSVPNWRP